jgi:hypothetical protein
MLLKLSGHISNCLERAAAADQRAADSTDSATRGDNELLAQSWRHLARCYQFVESLERFLSETDPNDREVLPPELLAIVEEQPAVKEQPVAPESKPIIPRPRVKHQLSFKDRLLRSAQDARKEAAGLPAGAARERLLLKAQESETAADIEVWISMPGSRPPDKLALTKKPRT